MWAATEMDLFAFLLGEPLDPTPIESPRAAFERVERLGAFASTIDRAAAGGLVADRLGYAFLAGYRAALARLDPTLSRASLCATESGGAHPRAIATRLEPRDGAFVLTGEKTYATLASLADTLLVVASVGVEDGRNRLRVARVPASRAGVVIRERDPVPFAPEIPHARVSFDAVRVSPSELLEGDGYEGVLKPFRTHEDMHVSAAWLGHVIRLARLFRRNGQSSDPNSGERRALERALGSIAALRDLASRDPLDPALHLALSGVFLDARACAEGLTLEGADETTRARWQRDLPLLEVAGAARELRREAAWRRFGPPAP